MGQVEERGQGNKDGTQPVLGSPFSVLRPYGMVDPKSRNRETRGTERPESISPGGDLLESWG